MQIAGGNNLIASGVIILGGGLGLNPSAAPLTGAYIIQVHHHIIHSLHPNANESTPHQSPQPSSTPMRLSKISLPVRAPSRGNSIQQQRSFAKLQHLNSPPRASPRSPPSAIISSLPVNYQRLGPTATTSPLTSPNNSAPVASAQFQQLKMTHRAASFLRTLIVLQYGRTLNVSTR